MNHPETITVLGAGYVGLTSAVLFSLAGYKVYVIEPNNERFEAISAGQSFFFEQGINEALQRGIANNTLIPTQSYEDSVPSSDIIFSCVGTPDNTDGSIKLDYVYSALESTLSLAKEGAIYVQKSTVPVGTGSKLIEIIAGTGKTMLYVSNPEFLREGTAIFDTLCFDRVVIGGDDTNALNKVEQVYRTLEKSREDIAAICGLSLSQNSGNYIQTNLQSAELIKVTANAFLALKISFANSIAILADKSGADITEVMDAVGADARIGRAFLNAGRGYGGGCFPKDVGGLIASAASFGAPTGIMSEAQDLNESMPAYVVDKIHTLISDLHGSKATVLGLAFKAGTSDVRKSPGIHIAKLLFDSGANVTVYDTEANEEAAAELPTEIKIAESRNDAIRGADVVVIATDWPEFKSMREADFSVCNQGVWAIDAMNCLDKNTLGSIRYSGIGTSKEA